ncbi:MAG TPA: hypothetical protein PK280_01855 [Planctomycetota bacterium]|nr:hypothetical protein [Planctomycetota bacterium]
MRKLAAYAGILLGAVSAAASAAEPATSFAAKPAAVRAGDKVTISFAASGKTDVEVAILDAKGEVVRHLAAGVLGGEGAPPAPLKAGLAQSLEWDGRDDYGQPVANAGGCSVHVRLGMGAKLDKIVGGDPYAFWTDSSGQGDHSQWRVTGLEAKPDGNVYLFGTITSTGLPALRQYDARGNYRRTVFPPPAGKPLDDVKGWGVNVRADGTYSLRASYGWCSTLPSWPVVCGGGDGGRLWCAYLMPTPESGTLCLASLPSDGNRQMTVGTDGTLRQSAPAEALGGEPLPKVGLVAPIFSALAPDGKSLYVSGLAVKTAGFWREGQVWKLDLASRKTTAFFALAEEEMKDRSAIGHSDPNPYSALQGVAVDAEGRVFVCDRLNKRLAVLDKDGKLIRTIPVTNPDAVAVNPKSKAVYVTTRFGNYGGNGELKLLKFSDWSKDNAPAATVPLRTGIGKFRESSHLALAEDKGETMVWVAYTTLPARVYRDAGAGLELVKDFFEAGPQRALDIGHMMMDPKTGDAYLCGSQSFLFRVRDWQNPKFEYCMLDAKTRLNSSSLAIDVRSRHLYTVGHYRDPFHRWALDGEFFTPAPVAGSNDIVPPITCAWVFTGLWRRGMAAAPGGGLATLGVVIEKGGRIDDYSGPLNYFKPDPAKTPWQGLRFNGFGGKNPNSGGVRFDSRGNLYVGLCDGKPKNVPPGFEKDPDFAARTGRIYKYAPTGTVEGGDLFPTEPAAPAKVYDVHYGSLSASSHFGVDGYGRIYYPTGLLPQVSVMDNEGNRVLAFGTYGNRDSLGGLPGDLVPTKDVPMAWPNSVDANDEVICVSDILNVRLMRLAKTFAAAETVGIK